MLIKNITYKTIAINIDIENVVGGHILGAILKPFEH